MPGSTLKLIIFSLLSYPHFGLADINPFLRPGTNSPPIKRVVQPPPPKPQVNPLAKQDVEFRGYITLNDNSLFCVFNKKSNRGEWVGLHEKTYEEFEIIGFNTQEETLILSYMNQEIRLSLLERSKTNVVKQSPPNLPSVNLPPAQANTSGSSARMMPPRPSLPPPMPAWLLERQKIRSTNPYSSPQQVSRTGSRFRGNQPLPFTPQQTSPKQPSASTNVSADPSFLSSSSSPSPQGVRPSFNPSSSPINVTSLPTAERNSFSVDPIINQNKQSDEDLFDDLPPPPPPPNILPPSPPPDIIPQR